MLQPLSTLVQYLTVLTSSVVLTHVSAHICVAHICVAHICVTHMCVAHICVAQIHTRSQDYTGAQEADNAQRCRVIEIREPRAHISQRSTESSSSSCRLMTGPFSPSKWAGDTAGRCVHVEWEAWVKLNIPRKKQVTKHILSAKNGSSEHPEADLCGMGGIVCTRQYPTCADPHTFHLSSLALVLCYTLAFSWEHTGRLQ